MIRRIWSNKVLKFVLFCFRFNVFVDKLDLIHRFVLHSYMVILLCYFLSRFRNLRPGFMSLLWYLPSFPLWKSLRMYMPEPKSFVISACINCSPNFAEYFWAAFDNLKLRLYTWSPTLYENCLVSLSYSFLLCIWDFLKYIRASLIILSLVSLGFVTFSLSFSVALF